MSLELPLATRQSPEPEVRRLIASIEIAVTANVVAQPVTEGVVDTTKLGLIRGGASLRAIGIAVHRAIPIAH